MLTTSKPTWPFILEHTIKFLHGGWTVPTFRTLIKFLSRDAYMSLWQDISRNRLDGKVCPEVMGHISPQATVSMVPLMVLVVGAGPSVSKAVTC